MSLFRAGTLLLFLSCAVWGADAPRVAGFERFGDKAATAHAGALTLLGDLNCIACHAADAKQAAWIQTKRAPDLARLAERAQPGWVALHLADPAAMHTGSTMPDCLHGLPAVERSVAAEQLVHFLFSNPPKEIKVVTPTAELIAKGEAVYHRVGCAACHGEWKDARSRLPALAKKWTADGLKRFLQDPLAVRPSGRMPSLKLSDGEATQVAQFLMDSDESGAAKADFTWDAEKARKGKELFAQYRCGACHGGATPAPAAPALSALRAGQGCLSESAAATHPKFRLNAAQKSAVSKALLELQRNDFAAPTDGERLNQTLMALNCYACHSLKKRGGVTPELNELFTANVEDVGDEGRLPPRLDGIGAKLKPEWLKRVLTQGASVRPYFNTRMPQFGAANVQHLPELFATCDAVELPIAEVKDSKEAQIEAGRKLVGTEGLACIACHRFNRMQAHALQMLDLTSSSERLNENWFHSFLIDPNKHNPGTRMPTFWPEDVKTLPTVLNGEPARQIAAIWTYLGEGPRAKFPEGLSRKSMELVVGGETVVYRGKLWESGFRSVAVGYPEKVNAAFDAEEMRLALLWRGRFLDASAHWSVQGMGRIRPLGTQVAVFAHGPELAVLNAAHSAWPSGENRVKGFAFHGYRLDEANRPTLRYALNALGVEDFMAASEDAGGARVRRTLRFAGEAPEGLHFRLAAGEIAPEGPNAWRFAKTLVLRVPAGVSAELRGTGEAKELIVPVRTTNGQGQLEIEYAW